MCPYLPFSSFFLSFSSSHLLPSLHLCVLSVLNFIFLLSLLSLFVPLLPRLPHLFSPSSPLLTPPLSPLLPLPPLPSSPHRKREKQLEEEIKKASEEKEPLARARSSSKDDKRGSRKESASSEHMGMDETPAAPSISPATPFHSIVRGTRV